MVLGLSRSTLDLLTVVFDRITRAFNRSGASRAVALDIFKAFDSLSCWFSLSWWSCSYVLRNFRSSIRSYFVFSQ